MRHSLFLQVLSLGISVVNDVVKAIFNALTAPNIDGEIINIGSGGEILVRGCEADP